MLTKPIRSQRGVTIIELLVGLAVGVFVVAGAIMMYISSIRSSNETLSASKLNQELAALMNVISNDVRRAGYWEAGVIGDFELNPFAEAGETLLTVYDMTSNTAQAVTGSGDCVVYAYDATYLGGNVPGTVDQADLFGFRLNGTWVEMLEAGTVGSLDCDTGTWQDVTDRDLIEITELTFDLANSMCLNGSEPNGVDDDGANGIDDPAEYNCYITAPDSGEATVETRELEITVAGQLANDTAVQANATQSVRVRNDYLQVTP